MQKVGKKIKEWLKAKPKLIEIYKKKGITRCENDGSRFRMSFHHRPSRASQEAEHTYKRTRLLCWECHPFFEHNEEADKRLFAKPRGYNPRDKIDIVAKKKSKKPNWQKEHKCKKCKVITRHYICHSCGEVSV